MSKGRHNDIWRYRKRYGLTQGEMAFLLGCEDGSSISRHERGAREPSLRMALACEALFGVPARTLFSGIYEEVEEEVKQRAHALSEQLEASPEGRLHWYKRTLLNALDGRKGGDLADIQ